MDKETIIKYFNKGDEIEITTANDNLIGKLIDCSEVSLVLEDPEGNPIIVALDSILSCKKKTNPSIDFDIKKNTNNSLTDENESIIKDIISSLNEIYEECSFQKDDLIPTNAIVTEITNKGVAVLTDNGLTTLCHIPSFVGYNRENAAVGKRVYCLPDKKKNNSNVCLTEMSYGEMYERFIRAANTRPKPRISILFSVLNYLTKEFGNPIGLKRKAIHELIKKLSTADGYTTTNSKKIPLDVLTTEQKNQIFEILKQHHLELVGIPQGDQIRITDTLISEHLGFHIKRKGVKRIITDFSQPEDENPFISATCEIKKYYPKYQNGSASDKYVEEIRFKEDVIVEEELKKDLLNFHFWEDTNEPIPAICVYHKTGNTNTALFVTRPGKLSEILTRIKTLKAEGRIDVANAIENFIDELGYRKPSAIGIDLNISDEELLKYSRRQRLIKNFEEAEKGFLELMSRGFEFDAVVRDLAAMYHEWQNAQKAISLLEENLPKLKEKVKTYNMLSLLYQSVGNKEKAIDIMEKTILIIPPTNKANEKKIAKLQKRIDAIRKRKKLSKLFSSEDIPSPLLRYEANSSPNEVLTYVSDKTIEDKLQFVKQRIGELKNSPDLPAYYLAEIQLLEEGGESGTSESVRMVLANYCKARARNFFNDGNESSARVYLLQGISILHGISNCKEREELVYLLLISLCTNSKIVLSKFNNPTNSYDVDFNEFPLREEDEVLSALLQMINKDSSMSRKLIGLLYESEASDWLFDELNIEDPTLQEFSESICKMSQIVSNKTSGFDEIARKILRETSPSLYGKSILEIPFFSTKEIFQIDTNNLAILREVANYLIDINAKNLGYDDCVDLCRSAFIKIDSTISNIERNPSPISTLNILPLLIKTKDMMERLCNQRYNDTLPQIIIEAIDDARPIEDEIEIQISVSNEKGCSRANEGVLTINSINGKDVSSLSLINVLTNPLGGGTKINIAFSIKSSLISSDDIEINYIFKYHDVKGVSHTKSEKICLAVNKGDDYEDFDNPYMAHVKSNAVKDKSMFKGRDEIIDRICKYVLDDYKGFVLYGQKRSGKSSVLYHITQRLRAEHKAFAVEYTMGNSIVQDSESENESMANLFYTITSEIGRAIKEVNRDVYKESGCHIIRRQEFVDHPDSTFREYLDFYRDIIIDKLHYEQNKIVLIVDEFTYLYYHILEGRISRGVMEFWKGLVESRVFSFVFAGQDAMPRFMDEFQNVFASMYPQELTYIDEKSARELIEEPIWNNKKNCSRFHPDAVDKIISLTACSPFYIMILCSELVRYARERKRLPIQVSDVDALVQRMICNESSISRKDFDNLISCGESRLDIVDKNDSLKVLKDIARKSRNIDYYDINAIDVFNKEKAKTIIDDLLRRGVLEPHPVFSNKIKIKVELFKRWLLNHE